MTRDPDGADCDITEWQPCPRPEFWRRELGFIIWAGDELYIPSIVLGLGELAITMMITHDGVDVFEYKNAIMVPERWARREFPHRCASIDFLRRQAERLRALEPQRWEAMAAAASC